MSDGTWELHGLKLSYFTGKLEAWLRARGLPFRFVEMDMAGFRACARATGVAQMPALRSPGGEWLTDTTAILRRLDNLELNQGPATAADLSCEHVARPPQP